MEVCVGAMVVQGTRREQAVVQRELQRWLCDDGSWIMVEGVTYGFNVKSGCDVVGAVVVLHAANIGVVGQ